MFVRCTDVLGRACMRACCSLNNNETNSSSNNIIANGCDSGAATKLASLKSVCVCVCVKYSGRMACAVQKHAHIINNRIEKGA